MRVQVEIEYTEEPPEQQAVAVGRAVGTVASSPDAIVVRRGRSLSGKPALLAEFEMRRQAQHRAVEEIRKAIYWYADSVSYSDMTIRFDRTRFT